MIYIGTSGWVYNHWRERFYPQGLPQREWLPFFTRRFPTVELNNSFYRLPTEDAFRRWRRDTPADFLFAVKVSRFITHIKRLKDVAEANELFWSRARLLGEKLGPMLYQLPPRFKVDIGRLEALLEIMPKDAPVAFEFRDLSWETDEVFELLDRHGVAFVYADKPGAVVPEVVTGGWAYIRFHQGQPLHPGYPRSKMVKWADRIAALPAKDVYVYFNNDPDGAALRDAAVLERLLVQRGVELAHTRAA